MSNQTLTEWGIEQLKLMGVGLVMGALMFMVIYAVIRKSPKRWWLWATGALAAMMAVMIMLAPLFIDPLLNKYTPMADGPVKSEILRIAHDQKIPTNDVFVVDRRSDQRSRPFSRAGPTIRIAPRQLLIRSTPRYQAVWHTNGPLQTLPHPNCGSTSPCLPCRVRTCMAPRGFFEKQGKMGFSECRNPPPPPSLYDLAVCSPAEASHSLSIHEVRPVASSVVAREPGFALTRCNSANSQDRAICLEKYVLLPPLGPPRSAWLCS